MAVLGIDVGGTKTVCLLADHSGHILAENRGSGANLQEAGESALEGVLSSAIERIVGSSGIRPSVVCLGIAGVDRPADVTTVRAIVQRLVPAARVLVVNDALIALQAGVAHASGIVIVAGTGSIAYGRNARGEAWRAGGWGYVLGDEGSAYWIGRLALRAVVRQADGRGRPTRLTEHLHAHFGVGQSAELIEKVYYDERSPRDIAILAGYVQRAREERDQVATAILDKAAEELLTAAAAVVRRLDLETEPFTFVLAGGMFKAVPWLAGYLELMLPSLAAQSTVIRLTSEPALGAVRLALDELRGGAHLPAYRVDQPDARS